MVSAGIPKTPTIQNFSSKLQVKVLHFLGEFEDQLERARTLDVSSQLGRKLSCKTLHCLGAVNIRSNVIQLEFSCD